MYFEDWILFDDTGLKGQAAVWARENIDGVLPDRLERCLVSAPEFSGQLARCDRVVYTVGFERRRLPETPQFGQLDYNRTNGILAPACSEWGSRFRSMRKTPTGMGNSGWGSRNSWTTWMPCCRCG